MRKSSLETTKKTKGQATTTARMRARSVAEKTEQRRAPRRAGNGASRAPSATIAPDALTLLRADHQKIRALLAALKDEGRAARRSKLLEQVQEELKVHTTIEEEIFYPAFREAAQTKKDQQIFYEALEEHHVADLILTEVARAGAETPEFAGRAKVLGEVVGHHADEEEEEMFPKARRLLPPSELRRLGFEMAERKRSLHPSLADSAFKRVASLLPFAGK
jgi:hypothetical protein